jgi:hypothetical protein
VAASRDAALACALKIAAADAERAVGRRRPEADAVAATAAARRRCHEHAGIARPP